MALSKPLSKLTITFGPVPSFSMKVRRTNFQLDAWHFVTVCVSSGSCIWSKSNVLKPATKYWLCTRPGYQFSIANWDVLLTSSKRLMWHHGRWMGSFSKPTLFSKDYGLEVPHVVCLFFSFSFFFGFSGIISSYFHISLKLGSIVSESCCCCWYLQELLHHVLNVQHTWVHCVVLSRVQVWTCGCFLWSMFSTGCNYLQESFWRQTSIAAPVRTWITQLRNEQCTNMMLTRTCLCSSLWMKNGVLLVHSVGFQSTEPPWTAQMSLSAVTTRGQLHDLWKIGLHTAKLKDHLWRIMLQLSSAVYQSNPCAESPAFLVHIVLFRWWNMKRVWMWDSIWSKWSCIYPTTVLSSQVQAPECWCEDDMWHFAGGLQQVTEETAHNIARSIAPSGGMPTTRMASTMHRVRSVFTNPLDPPFVAAFCQSNEGDNSPNVLGAFCLDSGLPCDFNHSTCNGRNELCVGRGPAYALKFITHCQNSTSSCYITDALWRKNVDSGRGALLCYSVNSDWMWLELSYVESAYSGFQYRNLSFAVTDWLNAMMVQ